MMRPKNVDSYIASAPEESRLKLLEFRALIASLVPSAEEGISYSMPAFKFNGKPLIGYAGYRHHVGFYPMSGTFLQDYQKELKSYKTSRGAVQFPLEKPLPVALIKKLVKARVQAVKIAEPKIVITPKSTKSSKVTPYTQYHKDGTIWGKGSMLGDQMHGSWEWFRKDGTKMRSGHFTNGKQTGTWITYDKNGRVVKVTEMR